MVLTLDIGNTNIKLAVFEQDNIIYYQIIDKNKVAEIITTLQKFNIKMAIGLSVSNEIPNEMLKIYNFIPFNHLTPLPLKNKYKTLSTLGLDRLAAVVGAFYKFPNKNNLIVDMGSCITYDFINNKNEYIGGTISLGLEMRLKALNYFTGKLPLLKYHHQKINLIGNSTENAIIYGVYNGMKMEIQGVINAYLQQYSDLNIVLTGGDFNLFDLEPKNRIFADKFLVLKGLNKILKYNAKN